MYIGFIYWQRVIRFHEEVSSGLIIPIMHTPLLVQLIEIFHRQWQHQGVWGIPHQWLYPTCPPSPPSEGGNGKNQPFFGKISDFAP